MVDLLTSGTGQDHVGVFARGSDRGDGTTVADTGTLVDDLLGHFEERLLVRRLARAAKGEMKSGDAYL